MVPQTRILAGSGIALILLTSGVKTAPTQPSPITNANVPHHAECGITLERAATARAVETLGALPLRFEANSGQFDTATKFAARGLGYGLSLTSTGAVLSLRGAADAVVDRQPVAGRRPARRRASRRSTRSLARFTTIAATIRPRGAPTCRRIARVRYAGVYDGIDLVYYGNQQRLEYDFEVAPGRDPAAIRLRFDGASRVEIDEATGDLLLHLGHAAAADAHRCTPLRQHKPITYQEIDGTRRDVESRYVIHPDQHRRLRRRRLRSHARR